MRNGDFEIERRFLIRAPEAALLRRAQGSRITQTYLEKPAPGVTERVRKRESGGVCVYTHTVKTRVNDLRRLEIENEISREEYERLLRRADPERRTLEKQRWCLDYRGQLFEIDLFPFWQDRALMEIELSDETQPVELPPEIEILKEVTHDKRYTNSSLAKCIPED